MGCVLSKSQTTPEGLIHEAASQSEGCSMKATNVFEDVQKLIQQLDNEISGLQEKMKKKDEERSDVMKELSEKSGELKLLKDEVEVLKTDKLALDKDNKQLKSENERLRKRSSTPTGDKDVLKGLDKELIEQINNQIVEDGEEVTFDDIAGLEHAKDTVNQLVKYPMRRPDLYTGLRACQKGLLLFGPPGTGKTMIAKAISYESGATFFSISSSALTSKWYGEGEKMVKTLFHVAYYRAPSIVFVDEVDSLLTQRKADEDETMRRIKTEFLVQFDGAGNERKGHVLVIGATNLPQELDIAARRRFPKRLYVPLPNQPARETLLRTLLAKNSHSLTDDDFENLSRDTDGYSGADLKELCTDAAMGPMRSLSPDAMMSISANDVSPISYEHFCQSLRSTSPSVGQGDLQAYVDWNNEYGTKPRLVE